MTPTSPPASGVRRPPRPGFGLMLRRGFVRHCPRCGSGHVFRTWFAMKERCPGCGHRFERRNDEDGFFLGAYVIGFGATEGAVMLALFAYIVAEASASGGVSVWPPLLVGGLLAVLLPLLFYPFSKTIWCAIDLGMHPLEDVEERAAAEAVIAAQLEGLGERPSAG